MIASTQPAIEPDADGYLVRFFVDSSTDLPDRCFEALGHHQITTRSLSILREQRGERRLSVTLRSGLCSTRALQKAVSRIVSPPKSALRRNDREGAPDLCGVP